MKQELSFPDCISVQTSKNSETLVCALFTEDDRYSVPTVSIVTVESALQARDIAVQALKASPHHIQIEARCGDDLLFTIHRDEIV